MEQDKTLEQIEDTDDDQTKIIRLTPTGKVSHAKTRVYTQRYRKEWEQMPDFKDWLTSVPFQATRAFCKFCQRNLHAHRLSLLKHMCTLKHQRAAVQYMKKQEQDDFNGQDDALNNYDVEQVDTDNGEDDETFYEDTCFINRLENDEQVLDQEDVESESETEPPVYKKMRIQKVTDQDTLAQAMIHVDSDLIDDNSENIHFEVVDNSEDPEDHVDGKQIEFLKCENSTDSQLETDMSDKNDKHNSTEGSQKISSILDRDEAHSKSVCSTSENSKKVLLFTSTSSGKSYTVLKGKIPQFLLNSTNSKNLIKYGTNESNSAKEFAKKNTVTYASTSQVKNKNNTSSLAAMTTKSILMRKPNISTHVLDTSKGMPVSGLQVILYKLQDGRWTSMHEGYTSANGTYNEFSKSTKCLLTVGRYKLHYDTEKYYSLKKMTTIYPFIEIVFDVKDPAATYHIPLLMSPFSYSTFKDSPR